MKTIFIFDSCGEGSIKFILADGDLSKFEGIYLNAYYDPDIEPEKNKLQEELTSFLYTGEPEWEDNVEYLNEWPYLDEPYKVVRIGAIP